MSIVTSLLHANVKEHLMTRCSADKTDFQGLFIFNPYVRLTIKIPKFALLTCVAIFGSLRIKGFIERGERNTGIKNCVQYSP